MSKNQHADAVPTLLRGLVHHQTDKTLRRMMCELGRDRAAGRAVVQLLGGGVGAAPALAFLGTVLKVSTCARPRDRGAAA